MPLYVFSSVARVWDSSSIRWFPPRPHVRKYKNDVICQTKCHVYMGVVVLVAVLVIIWLKWFRGPVLVCIL